MRIAMSVMTMALVAGCAVAMPTNTMLPGGWTWQSVGAGSYNTGLQGTERGGGNGQTIGPFNDTSFGVMDEAGTPWVTGNDVSAQQYVQRQRFGNFGTTGAMGRYNNPGYQGTGNNANFPQIGSEARSVSLNHWNNTAPDAGGVATLNQIVRVPVSATLVVGLGYGADEMILKMIGGSGGQRSQFFVDSTINASFSTTAFGIATTTGTMRVNAIVAANDAGGSNYDIAWGYGASNSSGDPSISRVGSMDAIFENGVVVGEPVQGLSPNSVGASISRTYDVLSSLVQTGGAFSINFAANAEIINLVRDFGNADARAQMGPGMEGNARLVVEYAEFRAVPTPGAIALLGLGGLVATRRRRA